MIGCQHAHVSTEVHYNHFYITYHLCMTTSQAHLVPNPIHGFQFLANYLKSNCRTSATFTYCLLYSNNRHLLATAAHWLDASQAYNVRECLQ